MQQSGLEAGIAFLRSGRMPRSLALPVAVLIAVLTSCREDGFDVSVSTIDGRKAQAAVVTFPGFEFKFGWVGSRAKTYSQCLAKYPHDIDLAWIDDLGTHHEVSIPVPQEKPPKYPEDRYELVIEIDGPVAKARIAVDDTPSSLRRMPEDRTLYRGSGGAAPAKSTDPPPPG